MLKATDTATIRRLLTAATVGVFLGRAWQHLYWDAPLRALLWDERLMRLPVRWLLGRNWDEYVLDPAVDDGIQGIIQAMGWYYLLAAAAALWLFRRPRLCRPVVFGGGVMLVFLAFLYTKEKFFLLPQFIEFALQFGSPFFLLAFQRQGELSPRLILAMKIATALTFTGHGLFAMGFVPTPGYFLEMIMLILGLSQEAATGFLHVAGVLDIVVSVLIFLPAPWIRIGLAYAVFWGAATTAARVLAYFQPELWQHTLAQWLHESVMRVPHFLMPLALLVGTVKEKEV